MPMQATAGMQQHSPAAHDVHSQQSVRILVLGALGVVYGDIGTSPLYAFREALFVAASDGSATREDVLGILSLIIWALTLIVTVKYVIVCSSSGQQGRGRHALPDVPGWQ